MSITNHLHWRPDDDTPECDFVPPELLPGLVNKKLRNNNNNSLRNDNNNAGLIEPKFGSGGWASNSGSGSSGSSSGSGSYSSSKSFTPSTTEAGKTVFNKKTAAKNLANAKQKRNRGKKFAKPQIQSVGDGQFKVAKQVSDTTKNPDSLVDLTRFADAAKAFREHLPSNRTLSMEEEFEEYFRGTDSYPKRWGVSCDFDNPSFNKNDGLPGSKFPKMITSAFGCTIYSRPFICREKEGIRTDYLEQHELLQKEQIMLGVKKREEIMMDDAQPAWGYKVKLAGIPYYNARLKSMRHEYDGMEVEKRGVDVKAQPRINDVDEEYRRKSYGQHWEYDMHFQRPIYCKPKCPCCGLHFGCQKQGEQANALPISHAKRCP